MISHISRRKTSLLVRQLSSALAVALSMILYMGPSVAPGAVLVDDFSDTINTPPFGFRLIEQNGIGSTPLASQLETGLSGVIGGSRQTTVSITAGVTASASAAIFAGSPGVLQFTSDAATGNLKLNYDNSGTGLGVGISPFLGVSIPFDNVLLGSVTSLPVTATLTDAAANVATAMVDITTEGTQTLIIPAAAFAGLDTLDQSNIKSIMLTFAYLPGQEFTLNGPIQLLTPEPLAILGWSVVMMIGLAGWRCLGPRLRAAR